MKKLIKLMLILIIFGILLILPNYVSAYTIALDAGHGGDDGAGAYYNGLREEVMTEATVSYMTEYFKQYDNITIIKCPKTGSGHYEERPAAAKNNNADIHVTIHYNAGGGTGVETLYKSSSDSQSVSLAQTIVNSISQSTGLSNRGIVVRGDLGIISTTSNIGCPSVCVEGGFIDNQNDRAVIGTNEGLKKVAAGTVSAILKYLGVADKGYPDIPDYSGYTGAVAGSGIYSVGKGITEVKSNENKFLGLWKNPVGYYVPYYNSDGTVNPNAVYDPNGKVVEYSSFGSPANAVINSPEWLFELLSVSERTQEHINIMKYLMYVYSGKDYGVTEYDFSVFDIETFSTATGYGSGSVTWNNSMTKDEFINICKSYTPSSATYLEGWNNVFIPNLDVFYDASVAANISPLFTISVAVHESAYGTSEICRDKNNLFGYRAEDGSAYESAWKFDSVSACINHWTKWMSGNYVYNQHYYDPKNQPSSESNDASYRYDMIVEKGMDPTTIEGIGSLYASDGGWANKVKSNWTNIFGEETLVGSGDFLQVAKQCHDYMRQNGYVYINGTTIPADENSTNGIDCSAYVTWVLYEYGYTELKGYQKTTYWFMNKSTMESYGWTVKPATQAQPGDIVVNNGHMEIYAGYGQFYNAGSTSAIQREISNSGEGYLSTFTYAITVTKP